LTLNDFLKNTSGLKQKLTENGLDEEITNAFLGSSLKIIDVIYKYIL
jgi:hypothetical protein